MARNSFQIAHRYFRKSKIRKNSKIGKFEQSKKSLQHLRSLERYKKSKNGEKSKFFFSDFRKEPSAKTHYVLYSSLGHTHPTIDQRGSVLYSFFRIFKFSQVFSIKKNRMVNMDFQCQRFRNSEGRIINFQKNCRGRTVRARPMPTWTKLSSFQLLYTPAACKTNPLGQLEYILFVGSSIFVSLLSLPLNQSNASYYRIVDEIEHDQNVM